MVRLCVLDEVSWDGRPVAGERVQALLRALAAGGARGLGEQALIEELWAGGEERMPANPAKALQVVVSRTRAATSAGAVERTATGYRLRLAVDDVDAWSLRPDALRLASEGEYAEALPLLHRLGDDDDAVVEARLRATAAVHGVPAALADYATYRERLTDALGVDPAPRLQALHAELLARDAPVRDGVRHDADVLIGRDGDVTALARLVRQHRLVSILGAGGLGKTRLAHVMGRLAEEPVVHFVELVSVTGDEDVAVEVADALGARESLASRRRPLPERTDPLGRVVDLLGGAPTLLILDNCEQVVAGVADLVSALLARTPALRVLTTTRIPLGLAAERCYLLPELSAEDATALFLERAHGARPGAVLDPARVRTLVERLDGLPLAVELAAARIRVMSLAEIERRLEDRFALLRGGARDAPARHQTLLAVIDWSWNLLSEPQRLALCRLSVFRDGFSLDGASAILGYDAVDVVTALAEQSLVVVVEDGELRYRLLETVREFGRLRLAEAGEEDATLAGLRTWALELCERARATLFGPDQIATMDVLRAEEGNLVEALRRGLAAEDATAVAVLLSGLTGFWSVEGSHLKIIRLGLPGLPLLTTGGVEPEAEDALRTALTAVLLTTRIFIGDAAEGTQAATARLQELGPGTVDPRTRALLLGLLALAEAGESAQLATLERLAESEDRHLAQWAAVWASLTHENAGDIAAAIGLAQRAWRLTEPGDGPWARAIVMAELAGLLLQSGDRDGARRYAEQASPALAALGAVEDWAQTRAMVAVIAICQGDLDDAEGILDELAADDRVQSVLGGGAISYECGRAELLLARGDVPGGLAAYRAAAVSLAQRAVHESTLPVGYEPWVLFPQAAALAAHCRFGQAPTVRAERDALLTKARAALAGAVPTLDHPVMGSVIFALGAWEVTAGDAAQGAVLIALSEAFSLNRMLPSMEPGWARQLVPSTGDAAELAAVPAERLREKAIGLLAQLR